MSKGRKKTKVEEVKVAEAEEAEIEEAEIEEAKVEEVIKPMAPPKRKKQLDRTMLVPVANFTTGTLVYKSSRTGQLWEFQGLGATDEIELAELITIRSSYPRILQEPWMLILDEEVIEYLGLTSLYQKLLPIDQIDIFLLKSTNAKFAEFAKSAPRGMKELLVSRVRALVKMQKFDSLSKIQVVEKEFGVDLSADINSVDQAE